MMHLLSSGAGCAFLPGSSALRQFPSATLSGRSAGCWRSTSKRQLSSARASTGGSGPGDSAGPVVAETSTVGDSLTREEGDSGDAGASSESSAGNQLSPVNPKIEKELKKAVQKTASTFAPRASTKTKNPAVPGTALYRVFEVQGYASMLVGGALSFNLVFPSSEPDIWRLMGMWSIWMFSEGSGRSKIQSEAVRSKAGGGSTDGGERRSGGSERSSTSDEDPAAATRCGDEGPVAATRCSCERHSAGDLRELGYEDDGTEDDSAGLRGSRRRRCDPKETTTDHVRGKKNDEELTQIEKDWRWEVVAITQVQHDQED